MFTKLLHLCNILTKCILSFIHNFQDNKKDKILKGFCQNINLNDDERGNV